MVKHFKCLGAFAGADGAIVGELGGRIGREAGAFRELEKVWRDGHLGLDVGMEFVCPLGVLWSAGVCLREMRD